MQQIIHISQNNQINKSMQPQKIMSKISDKNLSNDVIETYKPYRQEPESYKSTIITDSDGKKFQFNVPKQYQMLEILGKGSYGVVCAAVDKSKPAEDKQIIAIKKIEEPFQHKIITKRLVRELHLLKLLKHQNIIELKSIFMPYCRQQFYHVYVAFKFMDTDLHQILKSQQELTKEHYRFFLYQIIRALKYIHSAGIVHRDLKPRNLLVNANCDLKICDFGLSRSLTHKAKSNDLTDYVATRWYRAPELLLGSYDYTTSVDMWSVGCIFAQMLQRKPFLKGKNTKQQIQIIAQMIGIQGIQQIDSISEGGKKLLTKLSYGKGGGQLKKLFNKSDEQQLDLLIKLLAINPKQRISASEALKHPYFIDLHVEQDEPSIKPFPECDFEFEMHNMNTQQLKDVLYEQILTYNFPAFAQQYENKRKNNMSIISHILENSNKDNRDPNADQSEQEVDQYQ